MNNWKEVDVYDDSEDLAEDLRNIAGMLPPEDAYYLKEAAENLDGMWDLLNKLMRAQPPIAQLAMKKRTKKPDKSKSA